MSKTAAIPFATLGVALLLNGCGDPADVPARPDQIEKLNQVVERYPALNGLYEQAKDDGIITKREILAILAEGKKLTEAQQQ